MYRFDTTISSAVGWYGAPDLRGGTQNSSPTRTLLEFMESAYQAGAKSAGWDIEALRTHPPARETAKLGWGD
jgi:hypothetical protein